MANEAKRMCDWMKRQNRLITLSLPQPQEGASSQASVEDTPKPKPNKPDALPEEGAGSQASVEDSPKPKRRRKPNKPDAVPEEGPGSQASVEDSPNPKRRPNPNKT
uniref:Uncharacterized protein n=1 Tax=Setaria italica TaxID=4555 RepID=K4AML6_SETIT